MNSDSFENTYDELTRLNNTDGPNRNIFEPKFQAREQMKTLLEAVSNSHAKTPTLESQVQLGRCKQFIGNTMIETEEVAEGFAFLYNAFNLLCESVKGNVVDKIDVDKESELKDILVLNAPHTSESTGYTFVREYLSCLNTLGLHMCSTEAAQRMNDAKKILHLAEACYMGWDKHFSAKGGIKMGAVPISDEGVIAAGTRNRSEMLLRHRMDSLYTSTLFFLAQAYTQSDALTASKYAHLTMVHQLETKSEFSKKAWAENALHLCGFYAGQQLFGKALHCLQAGKMMMPTQPDDEETTGRVVWAYGRYHLSRLRYYAPDSSASSETFVDDTASWFVPFPLALPSVEKQPYLRSFDDAREEFKKANTNFQAALRYFAFDAQCTDHILILKNVSDLYRALVAFEPDVERQVAMHMRRMALLEKVPEELNPQAYLTTIRQLQFDVGDIANDIFDVRLKQKKAENNALGKPLSDKKMNALNDTTQNKYKEFLSSFKGDKQAEEVRLAIFRAKMRICSLLTKKFYSEPKDEYDAITEATTAYGDVLAFAEANPLGPEVTDELELARQMHSLLPGKKRAIAQAFQHPR